MTRQFSKINLKTFVLFLSISATLLAFVPPKYGLIGQWSILNLDGSPSGEYVDLTNMSFVAGVKKGANKVTAAQSVG